MFTHASSRLRFLNLLILLAMLASLGAFALPPSPASAAPADPGGPQLDAVGVEIVPGNFTGYTIGGGYTYWWRCGEKIDNGTPTGFLKRRLDTKTIVTLSTATFCGEGVVADASGLYYWLGGKIFYRAVGSILGATELAAAVQPLSAMVLSNDTLYWLGSDANLYRMPKTGGTPTMMLAAGANPTSLLLGGERLYWFGGTSLRSTAANCNGACSTATETNSRGTSLVYDNGRLYWNIDKKILWRTAGCPACTNFTLYDLTGSSYLIRGQLATNGFSLFWVENSEVCGELFCVPGPNGRLQRRPLDANSIATIDQPLPGYGEGLKVNAFGVYYEDTASSDQDIRVYRLPANAVGLNFDLTAAGWEITQGIQNLNNAVPLVAEKTTYVRAYGAQLSGAPLNWVHAVVQGTRNGSPLPGSPLQPLNGTRSLAVGQSYDRAVLDDGWLFRLPKSWTSGGNVQLKLVVDPARVYPDGNRLNNERSFTANFLRKAPVCTIFVPVRTAGSKASPDSENFWQMVDRFKTLWPIGRMMTYAQTSDVAELEAVVDLPPWKYGPYEITEDNTYIINALVARDVFTDDPDECDALNADVNYMGMVSANTSTLNPEGGTNTGLARLNSSASWVKLPPAGPNGRAESWNLPDAGSTMAQEFSHNYNGDFNTRWMHVDCGDPDADSLNESYPYDPCTLDDGPLSAAGTHYGFDVLTLTPIAPDSAADYMSYGPSKWVSDYTWRGMLNELNDAPALNGVQSVPAESRLAAADEVIYISGAISETGHIGSLGRAWKLPSSALSANVLAKLDRLAVPSLSEAGLTAGNDIVLRLLAADGTVLDERALSVDSGSGHSHGDSVFTITFPAPVAPIRTIELRHADMLLDSFTIGATAPTLSIVSPAAGSVVTDQMIVTWQAADADAGDQLETMIQYSPNQGQTWQTLETAVPVWEQGKPQSATFSNLENLPGSNGQALVRVAVSDGLNTTLATSQPFTVAERAPQARISAPSAGRNFAAGQPIVVSGGAIDAEDGPLADAALSWKLNGVALESGEELLLSDLAPGAYTLELTASDSAKQTHSVSTSFTVSPLAVPQTAAPSEDGLCTDAIYAAGAQISLSSYADGNRATAQLVRSADQLYLCIDGLSYQGQASPGATLRILLDTDAGREQNAQAEDYMISLDEEGNAALLKGSGNGGYTAVESFGLAMTPLLASETWSAEVRISSALLGEFERMIGLAISHVQVNASNDRYSWPANVADGDPRTWGLTLLGDLPTISGLTPETATAGSAARTIDVAGSNFAADAQVLWNGEARSTTWVSAELLTVELTAADLALAGEAAVSVDGPNLADANLAPATFTVVNPAPTLSSVVLNGSTAIVRGSNFAPGATIIWNGVSYSANRISASEVQAIIFADDRVINTDVPVAVANPAPGGGLSNSLTYSVPQTLFMLHLPMMLR